ncbi:hypothetical protein EBA29_01814 [Bacillus velezensis]|nr:hypothetical protein EBA29_01814 [Bacillus velezensis]
MDNYEFSHRKHACSDYITVSVFVQYKKNLANLARFFLYFCLKLFKAVLRSFV